MQEPNSGPASAAASATATAIQGEVNQPDANRSASQAIQEFKAVLEPLARLGAILLGATYLVGFLIVMQHHATFGIVDVGLLRARVMAAGILFDFLTVLPIIVASRVYGWLGLSSRSGHVPRTRNEDRVSIEIMLAVYCFVGCAVLAGVLAILFITNTQSPDVRFMLGLIPGLSLQQ